MCLLNPSLIYSCGAAEARTREAGMRSHTTHIWMILCQHSLSPKRPQMVHANWAGRNAVRCWQYRFKKRVPSLEQIGSALSTNFSSAARSCGGSIRLRTKQASRDPSAGARMSWVTDTAGTVPARISNMKQIPAYGGCLQTRERSAPCVDTQ